MARDRDLRRADRDRIRAAAGVARTARARPSRDCPARRAFAELAWNSFRVAGLTAVLAVAFAITVGYAVRLAPGALTHGTSRLLTLGYAVPGSVLAVGVLLPLGAADVWLAAVMQQQFGLTSGPASHRAPSPRWSTPISSAYFAVAWNGIEPGFARDHARAWMRPRAASAPAPSATLTRVHAPLLARSLGRRCAARVRRRDEGAAGHARAAPVQLRHARDRRPTRSRRTSASPRPRCPRSRSSPSACCPC